MSIFACRCVMSHAAAIPETTRFTRICLGGGETLSVAVRCGLQVSIAAGDLGNRRYVRAVSTNLFAT